MAAPAAKPEKESAPAAAGGDSDADLQAYFEAFCKFGDKANKGTMDGAKFAKFCKDCKLISKRVTKTDVDLIFTQAKPKAERKISFVQFKKALTLVAAKEYPKDASGYDQVVGAVLASKGPASSGTKAEANKFHDDKSLYTGVHSNGGPSTNDNTITLSNLLDRSPADVRGRKT